MTVNCWVGFVATEKPPRTQRTPEALAGSPTPNVPLLVAMDQ